MVESLFVVSNVSKTFTNRQQSVYAVRNLNFRVQKNAFTVIAGRSGSGKTTTLNILGLLTPPETGEIEFDGVPAPCRDPRRSERMRTTQIGLVFQQFNLIPSLTIRENVEFPLLLLKRSRKQRRRAALETLEGLGLQDLADRFPDQVSGGQQQRAAIARALVKEPKVVLADEPTASLDTETSEQFVRFAHDLQRRYKTSFVLSSHDPVVIAAADEVLTMQDGAVIESQCREAQHDVF